MSHTNKYSIVTESETRALIAGVFHFLQNEYDLLKAKNPNRDLSILSNIRKRTAEATGVSEATVTNILKEERELSSVSGDQKLRKRIKSKYDMNHVDTDMIKFAIEDYYSLHEITPSITVLLDIVKETMNFQGCYSTLRKLVVDMGYKVDIGHIEFPPDETTGKDSTTSDETQSPNEIVKLEESIDLDDTTVKDSISSDESVDLDETTERDSISCDETQPPIKIPKLEKSVDLDETTENDSKSCDEKVDLEETTVMDSISCDETQPPIKIVKVEESVDF